MLNKKIDLKILTTSMVVLSFSFPAFANYYDDGDYDDNNGYYNHHSDDDMADTRSYRHHHSGSAPLPSKISSGNIIKVDLGRLVWGAYDSNGNLIKWGRASGGKKYCPDIHRRCRTVTGTYTIYSKKGAGCKSSAFPVGKGGAPMPYCMHFKGGYAIHGSYSVPDYNASHGCVRVPVGDAQWLNQEFVRVGGTRIHISY